MEDVTASLLLLLCGSLILGPTAGSGSGPDPERGRMELRRVQSLAAQPRYGGCWARALEHLDTRCRDMTSESQSRLALRFTHCHLSSSGRDFPSCPEGSEVSRCTAGMDPVAFNTYTEFFTHTHSICHFLQSEAWQSRTESTMYRLTEASAGVAEQLQSTRQMANELMEAQSVALQAQKEILSNGEELRATLRDSTQGVQAVFSDLSSASRQQQVALSQLFQQLSFLQSFLLMEAHSLTSCCYNAAALCTAYLITSTPRSSRARLLLLVLVCVNFYLEKKIYQHVLSSDQPEHLHVEQVSVYVAALRRLSVCVALCVLLLVCVRYRDPVQQSLEVLQQLRETQSSLQEALQRAERFTQEKKLLEDRQLQLRRTARAERLWRREEEEFSMMSSLAAGSSHMPPSGQLTGGAELKIRGSLATPGGQSARLLCRSSSHHASVQTPPPLVEDRKVCPVVEVPVGKNPVLRPPLPRYSLRSRRRSDVI
ncbi:uncharacterized protein LOC103130738 isoform X1 [Poecilia formosa]|uniref:uncharacterized protein LOC103130738 isoform X1 n=1 Tax=Poecilia formosa TaxID=48698 RepID=UPI0004443C86|nr:PREDICTED: uncharacterized protein LOC103130738 isoform X1 [Poecilia formosa]